MSARYYPGVPIVPTRLAGATGGVFMGDVGIPDLRRRRDLGLNERIGVETLYQGRDYLWDLVNLYGMQG